MKMRWMVKHLFAIALLAWATPAWAQSTPVAPGSEGAELAETTVSATEEAEDSKSWSVGANMGISMGIGTLVSDEYARRSRVRWNLGLNGSYTIPVVDVDVGLSTGFSQWLTEAGGSQTVQEFRWSDTNLGFSRSIYTIPVVDIAISGGLDFTIPTSSFSRASGLYTSISPSLSFSGSYGPLSVSYSLAYAHNFYEYTSMTFDPADVDILSRGSGNETISRDTVAQDGVLGEFGLYNQFSVAYSFLDDFRLSIGFGFSDDWTFDNGTITEEDDFTSEYASVGRGHSQRSNGSLRLSYSPLRQLSFSASMTSSQPWKTDDNSSYRFPFIDLESPANNFTYFGLGANFNY